VGATTSTAAKSVCRGVTEAVPRLARPASSARGSGYFVDLTQVRRDETEANVQTALARVAEH